MLRKHILTERPAAPISRSGEKDIAAIATVLVTSEAADHPIDLAFDNRRGPGGSRWVGEGPGEQTLMLAFATPQTIRKIRLEVEEQEVSRTQELQVSISYVEQARGWDRQVGCGHHATSQQVGNSPERPRWCKAADCERRRVELTMRP